MPVEFLDAFWAIENLATAEAMDDLLELAEKKNLRIDFGEDPSPADVAVKVWLQSPEILERKNTEQQALQRRSFKAYRAKSRQSAPISIKDFSQFQLQALGWELEQEFLKRYRGRGCRVTPYQEGDLAWFSIRHGEPFRRDGSLDNGRLGTVHYRPATFDLVIYSSERGSELRINAETKWLQELYQAAFGHFLFGDKEHFRVKPRNRLFVLQTQGREALRCDDIPGMKSVRLKEIHFRRPKILLRPEKWDAWDIFENLKARGKKPCIDPDFDLLLARFVVKLSESGKERSVTIEASNSVQYTQDEAGKIIENWLRSRGFMD